MKLSIFAKIIFVLIVLSSTACLRRQSATAPAGYISESQCLRLISGQAFVEPAPKIQVVEDKEDDSCFSKCCESHKASNVNYNAKRVDAVLPGKKTDPAKKTVKIVKPRTPMSSSSRASLNIKAVQNDMVVTKTVVPVKEKSAEVSVTPKEEIIKVQKALNAKGAKLEVDGVMGERTVRLIKAFQTMNDLPVSGKVDEPTAVALGVK